MVFTRVDQSIFIGAGYGSSEATGRIIPNVAGALLFYPDHPKIIPESELVVSVYADTDKQHLIRKEEFSGGLIPLLEGSFILLSSLLGTYYERDGLIKQTVEHEIPLDAMRVALVNAVAHRAYEYEAPIRVTLFPDRIEFLNPGTFYAPINSENLKEGLSRPLRIAVSVQPRSMKSLAVAYFSCSFGLKSFNSISLILPGAACAVLHPPQRGFPADSRPWGRS